MGQRQMLTAWQSLINQKLQNHEGGQESEKHSGRWRLLPFCGESPQRSPRSARPAVGRRSAATTRAVDMRAVAAAEPIAATKKARMTAARPVVFPLCADRGGQRVKSTGLAAG